MKNCHEFCFQIPIQCRQKICKNIDLRSYSQFKNDIMNLLL